MFPDRENVDSYEYRRGLVTNCIFQICAIKKKKQQKNKWIRFMLRQILTFIQNMNAYFEFFYTFFFMVITVHFLRSVYFERYLIQGYVIIIATDEFYFVLIKPTEIVEFNWIARFFVFNRTKRLLTVRGRTFFLANRTD